MFYQKLLLLLACVGSSWIPTVINASPARSEAPQNVAAKQSLDGKLLYENGLLSGSANNWSVSATLKSLERIANLNVEQRYKLDEKESVSYQINKLDLQAGLKELLRDYSYLLIPPSNANGHKGKLILLNKKDQISAKPSIIPMAVSSIEIDPVSKENPEETQRKKAFEGPRGLNEFKPLPDLDPNVLYEQQAAGDQTDEQIAEWSDAKLQRALAALESKYENLKQDALTELKGMNAPEATAAILDAARGAYGKSRDLQYTAAKILWEHAADLNYKDDTANTALFKLREIKISEIDDIAHQALSDMEYMVSKQSE